MRFDRALDDRQSQAGPAHAAGHERLEQAVPELLRECPGRSSLTSRQTG